MKLLHTVFKVLLFTSGLSHAFVVPKASLTQVISSRDVASHDLVSLYPRAGTCPRVNLIKSKKCTRAIGAKDSAACPLPSNSKAAPKPTATKKPVAAPKKTKKPARPTPKPNSSKKPSQKANVRELEETIPALTLDERADKTLDQMNGIASFEWAVGDTAKTIGLQGCSVFAVYNDKAIVWGHYSPVITIDVETSLDYQETLELAFRDIETRARSMGILGATGAKGVVRVDSRAAAWVPLPGKLNIPQTIAAWFPSVGIPFNTVNRATYDAKRIVDGTCTIEHATSPGGEARVSMT